MLCPEVSNFPPPKVISSRKKFESLEKVEETFKLNNFYGSVIITLPDELHTPSAIEEIITEDSDYYKITDCSLAEFVEVIFIEKFVKAGILYCLSANRECMTDSCAAITPDGILTLHIIDYIFQTTGLEGIKRPHNFYEVKIDLKNITQREKLRQCFNRLELFDFYLSWEPSEDTICPSTIAKYFYEKNVNISVHTLQLRRINPTVTEIPSVKDVESDEMTEWIGMLALECDLNQKETYISNYSQPDSDYALTSTRVCVVIAKGFITPTLVNNLCKTLNSYVASRELENYWAAISVQSNGNSLWQWNTSSPRMFQAHDSSTNVFFTSDCQILYSIGQLKYS